VRVAARGSTVWNHPLRSRLQHQSRRIQTIQTRVHERDESRVIRKGHKKLFCFLYLSFVNWKIFFPLFIFFSLCSSLQTDERNKSPNCLIGTSKHRSYKFEQHLTSKIVNDFCLLLYLLLFQNRLEFESVSWYSTNLLFQDREYSFSSFPIKIPIS